MYFVDLLPVLMFVALGVLLFTGFPVGFILGGVGLSQAESAFEGTPEADSARAMGLGADVTLAISAACATGALIWLLVAPPASASETPTAMILPYASPAGLGVVAGGSF